MCDPVSASVAVAVVGGALKVGGAVAEHKAQNKQAAANERIALDSLKLQDHELSLREVEEKIAGAQQIDQGNREVASASGDVRASAASRGVGGMSVDLLINDIAAQGARYRGSVQANTDARTGALGSEKDAALQEARARIAGVPKASTLATGLKIGAAALDTYSSLKINRPKGI